MLITFSSEAEISSKGRQFGFIKSQFDHSVKKFFATYKYYQIVKNVFRQRKNAFLYWENEKVAL